MKFSDVMIHYNYNMSNISRALGISRQSVEAWRNKKRIPYPRQCEIEILTKGELKANKED
jgi:hypothetical protein